MDLRSGQCFWLLRSGLTAVYAPLESDAACDVAIVGGGITGALLAHHLTGAGLDCIVLDRRDIGWGSTMASTALLQYELDIPLTRLGAMIGPRDAGRAYTLCARAVGELEEIVARLADPAEFRRRPSLFLARHRRELPGLERECAARAALGIGVEFLGAAELGRRFGIDRPGAIRSDEAGEVDPFRLTHSLLRDAMARGLRVFDRTAVTRHAPRRGGVVLATAAGPKVGARHVVYTTGYEAQSTLRERIVSLRSTFALVTEPMDERLLWPQRCMIWETGDPYCYWRTTADGRAMIGGGDTPFRSAAARDRLLPRKATALERRLRAAFPAIRAGVAFAWAGTFGRTRDSLPYAGASPEFPGALFSLGFGGNGMIFSTILASVIADAVSGRPNDDARLFRFGR